jgi:hypothetical protein
MLYYKLYPYEELAFLSQQFLRQLEAEHGKHHYEGEIDGPGNDVAGYILVEELVK